MAGRALIAIDVQIDFCPGGALAVAGGDEIVAEINALAPGFEHLIITQDWHPASHSSFATSHPGKQPFETVEMHYGDQTLWPEHCVQGSPGADLHPLLDITRCELILRKGFRHGIDSYSAFFENDRKTPTGLGGYLKERGITDITLAGLATDYCVGHSALDAARLGLKTAVAMEASRAIDLDGSLAAMAARMREAGVELL
jgi:nicotinamidase/pyrazinamidase